MKQSLRFGIGTLQNLPWGDTIKLWQHIERLGFDSIWVADHFVNYMQPSDPWFESWSLLSALATMTNEIRIGTLVTSIPLRNPVVLSRQALTVDHISNGRLELGLGAGAPGTIDPQYKMTGIRDWPPAERVLRFKESVEIIDRCLRNKTISYHGQYYTVENAIFAPAPVQKPRPPLTIGAMRPKMIKIAAKYADTWNSFGDETFGAPQDLIIKNTRKRIELLDHYCAELDRDPDTIRRSLLVFGADAGTVFASEDNFRETVNRYVDIGITELIFFYPFFDESQQTTFEVIAKEIIPKLRINR